MHAKKTPHGPGEARELLAKADRLIATKGARVHDLALGDTDLDEALGLMIGPSGNLRAPTLRRGKTVFVGFPKGGFEALPG